MIPTNGLQYHARAPMLKNSDICVTERCSTSFNRPWRGSSMTSGWASVVEKNPAASTVASRRRSSGVPFSAFWSGLGIIPTARSFLRTDTGLLDDATPDFDFRPEKCADALGSVGPALVTERRQASLNARISERGNGIGVHFRDDLGRGLGRHKKAVP